MKRKLEHLTAKLAFEELDPAEAEKLRRLAAGDAETERAVREYAAMRADLKKLGERTPEASLSTERLRDAILNEGLGSAESRRARQTLSWVWAPVATAVLAYGFASFVRRQAPQAAPPATPVVANRDKTDHNMAFPELKIALRAPEKHAAKPRLAVKATHVHKKILAAPGIDGQILVSAKIYDPQWDMDSEWLSKSYWAGRTERLIRDYSAPGRWDSLTALRTETDGRRSVDTKAGPSKPATPNVPPIVIIQPDTDGQTGAQRATEVESVANVLVGG